MRAFQLKMHEMRTAQNVQKQLISTQILELVSEDYQGRPLKCAHFTHFKSAGTFFYQNNSDNNSVY